MIEEAMGYNYIVMAVAVLPSICANPECANWTPERKAREALLVGDSFVMQLLEAERKNQKHANELSELRRQQKVPSPA